MSILQIIEMTRRSFETSTAAINVIGQNIANEQTEGYKRRRIELRASSSNGPGVLIPSPIGVSHGNGVTLESIQRIQDRLLSSSAWEARSGLGASDEESRLLSAIENLFPPNGESSFSNTINEFWNGWSDLANDPTDLGVRQSLIGRASNLVAFLNRTAGDLDALKEETRLELQNVVDEFNTNIERVAELNTYIQSQRARNTPDFAAEDERDGLIEELAELAPVHVQEGDLAMYNLTVHGMMVVQGGTTSPLSLDTSATPATLTFANTSVNYNAPAGDDGRIGAILRTLNTTIPTVEQQLDDLAASLVDRINAIHSTGYDLDGNTGLNFFDPAGTTADTLSLSADIAGARAIAASGNPDPSAQGDNATALAIVNERAVEQTALNDATFENFALDIVSSIGSQLQAANGQFEGHSAVVSYLSGLERGVSGVSINEELTRLIQFQQSFSAAARVLNSAQAMMDSLLSL